MKANLSVWHLLTVLALLAPAAALLYYYPTLPAQLPTHFGLDGQADGFTAKGDLWLLAGVLPLGVYLLLGALPRLDPKRRVNTALASFQKLRLLLVLLVSGLALHTLYLGLHPGGSGAGLAIGLALFFAALGNYLSTVPPNYFVGLRTPWALEFPDNWARTHRLVGRLWFGGGLLAAGLIWLLPAEAASPIMLGLVFGPGALGYLYSFGLYRQAARAATLAE